MAAQYEDDPRETARALYSALKDVMALFESGQIIRNTEHDNDFEQLQKEIRNQVGLQDPGVLAEVARQLCLSRG